MSEDLTEDKIGRKLSPIRNKLCLFSTTMSKTTMSLPTLAGTPRHLLSCLVVGESNPRSRCSLESFYNNAPAPADRATARRRRIDRRDVTAFTQASRLPPPPSFSLLQDFHLEMNDLTSRREFLIIRIFTMTQ